MLAYFHIPFCDSKCYYCAFNSYTTKHIFKEKYMEKIVYQLVYDLEFFKIQKGSISSLFIGGGTPSTIHPSMYEKFFQTIYPYLQERVEITVEANPNSASKKWLEGMKSLGANRVSFGVQSFYDDKLKFLGRAHNAKDAILAVENANALGFENISVDLMYGTTLDTKKRLEKECNTALSLPIDHISSYSLTLEENTPFWNLLHVSCDDEKLAHFFAHTLNSNGFLQYEVSNYGKYQCQHNLGYWKHKPYLGIGAGAVGFDGKKRYYPLKDIQKYINNPLFKNEELLLEEDLLLEKMFLGFRSIVGVSKSIFTTSQLKKIDILLQENKLTCKDERLFANDYFIADEIALFLS